MLTRENLPSGPRTGRNPALKNLVVTAMLIAVGLVLPTFFHLFGSGPALLPMHIPVLICGLACGLPYGAVCGIVLPYLSSFLTGMPVLFPTALSMSLELCVYGLMTGLLFQRLRWRIYPALAVSMLAGRGAAGLANAVLLGLAGWPYGLVPFLTASFVTGLPGIILQLVAVPAAVTLLMKARLVSSPRTLKT